MSQAPLHRQHSFEELDILSPLLSQPPSSLHYNHQAFEDAHQFGNLGDCHAIMQPMLVSDPLTESSTVYQQLGQYGPDRYMSSHALAPQQASPEDCKPSITTSANSSSPNQNFHGLPVVTSSFDWQYAIQQTESYTVPGSDGHYRQNHDLAYNPIAAQNTVVKGLGEYENQASWVPSGLSGMPRGITANGSDVDTNTSTSPKSYSSDDFDNTYSPGPVSDQSSPAGNWHGYPISPPNSALPLSHYGPYTAQKTENAVKFDLSGDPQMSMSMAMAVAPSERFRRQGDASFPSFGEAQQSGSKYSYSQASSPTTSPWYSPNYLHESTALPIRPGDSQGRNPHSTSDSSTSSPSNDRRTQHRSDPWNGSHTDASTQHQMQARFQVSRSCHAQAQREHNDNLLVEGKKKGWTYKEIKQKMVGEQPAESTLRGRYRSLTKARKDRVRKPVWAKVDIELLNKTVQHEFDRIEGNLQNPYSVSFDQKLSKVPWKKVAEYINDNGGTYHFGNSTCKRKWLELHPGRK
ncbi:hypothetical protein BDW02DRAFT_648109 [Decorospora gaudefroyi]|uniref:Myb-like domain-containing protein n=1 Tax=Decorospora gaudefroyi TaxID=184978 RepID=A0A6A5K908_9PLEO|nr:hypothetical protein BDW02DRAFT_648109 [Decorospora gaudefroyi]